MWGKRKRCAGFIIRLTLVLEARGRYFPLSGPQESAKGTVPHNETSTAWKALKPYFPTHCHHVKFQAVLFIIKQNFCIQHGNLVFHNQGKIITFHYGCSLMNENENVFSKLLKPLYCIALRTAEHTGGTFAVKCTSNL